MQQAMEPLIRLDGVSKVFYTEEVETHALNDVHLEIRPGEYVAIAGPSGGGGSGPAARSTCTIGHPPASAARPDPGPAAFPGPDAGTRLEADWPPDAFAAPGASGDPGRPAAASTATGPGSSPRAMRAMRATRRCDRRYSPARPTTPPASSASARSTVMPLRPSTPWASSRGW